MSNFPVSSDTCDVCGLGEFVAGNILMGNTGDRHFRCYFPLTPEEVRNKLLAGKTNEVLRGLIWDSGQFAYLFRDTWKHYYRSFALPPTLGQLDFLGKLLGKNPILELGCGVGLWAAVLRSYGFNVQAVDVNPEHLADRLHLWSLGETVTEEMTRDFVYTVVEKISADEALDKYPETEVLLLVWPQLTFSKLDDFLGKYVIIVGEGPNGCTGSEIEYRMSSEWQLRYLVDTPRFGSPDIMAIYERPDPRLPKKSHLSPKLEYISREGLSVPKPEATPSNSFWYKRIWDPEKLDEDD